MAGTKRIHGRHRAGLVTGALALCLVSGAFAQDRSEVARLAEEARAAFVAAETTADPARKASLYETARARVRLVEKFAGSAAPDSEALRTAARQELEVLADDGLGADLLGATLLRVRIAQLKAAPNGARRVELGTILHTIAGEQRSPIYRVAALVELGRAYQEIGAVDRALRYAELGFEAAREVSGLGEQSGAYNSVAQLAALQGQAGARLANKAIAAIPRARDRAEARRSIARLGLKGTSLEKASEADLTGAAGKRVSAGDLTNAATLAFALPEGQARRNLLSKLVGSALAADQDDLALAVVLGMGDEKEMEKAVATLTKTRIESGAPLRALDLAGSLPDGPAKASALVTIAEELGRAGYDTMAGTALERAGAVAGGDGEVAQATRLAVAAGLIRAGKLDEAATHLADAPASPETSALLGRLGKLLADADRIADAEKLLDRLTQDEDRDLALSGIARAAARSGDLARAETMVASLTDPDHAGNVLAGIAKRQAQDGALDAAAATARRIGPAAPRVEALVEIGRQAGRKGSDVLRKASYDEALQVAMAAPDKDRDRLILNIVTSLAEIGLTDEGRAVAARIEDRKIRDRAHAALAHAGQGKRAARDTGAIEATLAALRAVDDDRVRGRAFRVMAQDRVPALNAWTQRAVVAAEAMPPVDEAEANRPILSQKGVTLNRTAPAPLAIERLAAPDTGVTAQDVRSRVPLPGSGRSGIVLSRQNPFLVELLDETRLGAQRSVVVTDGVATLDSVRRHLADAGVDDLVVRQGDAFLVRAPLVIMPGATLILSGAEASAYRLAGEAGALLVNAGTLYVVDTTLVGYDEANGRPLVSDGRDTSAFRPYVIAWNGSRTLVAGSSLTALGYDGFGATGLTLSEGPGAIDRVRDVSPATGVVVDSTFTNLHVGIAARGAGDLRLVGNEIRDSLATAIQLAGSRSSLVALNTVHGTRRGDAVDVSGSTEVSTVFGNVLFENAGSGLVLDRRSSGNIVQANTVFRNEHDGLTVLEASCNVAAGNHLFGNGRDGVKLRNSAEVGLYGNIIEANRSSAVHAYVAPVEDVGTEAGQPASVTTVALGWNRLSRNRLGLTSYGASGVMLIDNRFVSQSRRLFGGDLRGLEGQVLRAASQGGVMVSGTCRPARPAETCALRAAGLLEGDNLNLSYDPAGSGDCTGTAGTIQNRAFLRSARGT